MLKRVLWVGLAFLGVIAIGASIAWREVTNQLAKPHQSYSGPGVFVAIVPGDSTRVIASRLMREGVVVDARIFRFAVWKNGLDRVLQAGEYYFDTPLSPLEVVGQIARGRVYLRTITFPEGLTVDEMANLFESESFGSAESFLRAAHRVELVSEMDPGAENLEGYLFPETYSLPRDATADDLVEEMVAQFEATFTDELRAAAVQAGFSVREVVTLASIIQKETGSAGEHAIVAAVIRNRLNIGMPLQCDPTVIYALRRAGQYDGNLTRTNLQFDSPYNTYRYGGIPPGPIAAPGGAVLEATLHPADVPFLYFVSRNDGTHAFSTTLREHNRNVREFQVEYFRRRNSEN